MIRYDKGLHILFGAGFKFLGASERASIYCFILAFERRFLF